MKDRDGRVIYVGKSRKLHNRVSQYFQNGEKNIKTARMVAGVHDFDYFLCETEIEALTLENTLIKQHTPKYNIKLKDAKSYPYIKITDEPYPRLVMTRRRENDRGRYFGPYSGYPRCTPCWTHCAARCACRPAPAGFRATSGGSVPACTIRWGAVSVPAPDR